MTFEQWAAANEYDLKTVTATARKHLEVAYHADISPPVAPPIAAPVATLPAGSAGAPTRTSLEIEMDAAILEADRREGISLLVSAALRDAVNYPERVRQLKMVGEAAIDSKWSVEQTSMQLQLARFRLGPISTTSHGEETNSDVLEAALMRAGGFRDIEKHFDERTLAAVDKHHKRGLSLCELVYEAAHQNGRFHGSRRDLRSMLRAAMMPNGFEAHAGSPSTIDVGTILSNVANKYLETGFMFTEQVWRQWVRIMTANDYKEQTRVRLDGDTTFKKVGRGGEIKHGQLSELTYGMKVDPYAIMIGISEEDFRNDDTGAFGDLGDLLGRGGGEKLNTDLYAEWLDDAAFFPTDASNANYDAGATDTLMDDAGLTNAVSIFMQQTGPNGTPFGYDPAIVLVPVPLKFPAEKILFSNMLSVVSSNPVTGTDNVHRGLYKPVTSKYLKGSSDILKAWYMIADPIAVAAMAVGFLDGVDRPMVETADFDFDRLGFSMRGTFRYGVRKQEYRAAVKLKGQA